MEIAPTMDNTGTVMIGEENYQVVDECTEEEEVSGATRDCRVETTDCSKSCGILESTMQPSSNIVQQPDSLEQIPEISIDTTSSHNNDTDEPVRMEVECEQQPDNNAIDFTVDISLDQLDTQKEMTDEDVMHHLDVIENIELDAETFGMDQPSQPESSTKETEEQKQEIKIIDEIKPIEESWYKNKIAEKEALVRERLSKLARVLGISYPHYEKWLERIEKKERSPMCRLDPIQCCPLNKPHTNRWKFECTRKDIQEYIKEEGNADSSDNKSCKSVWRLDPTGTWGVNINNSSEFPSFVLKAVKIFEDFLQTTIMTEDAMPSNENSSNKASVEVDSKKDVMQRKQQWLWLFVRCNSKDELMLFATGRNISRYTMDRLKQTYESGLGKDCNVKSLYCKSINKRDNKIITSTTFLVGAEALDEVVGNLKVQLAPKTNFWSNAAGAANVAKAVADMLKPTQKVTIVEVGCGIGVIGLMMASRCRQVIGVDTPTEIEEAEITCELNNITNASFIMGSPADVVSKISAATKNQVTYAIVNANTNMGRAVEVMTCLRKLDSLRRIVMVTTLTKQSVRAVLELARPIEDELGHPFMPIRACVVDTLPIGPHFEAIILMERRLMHRLTQPWFLKILEEETKTLENTRALEKVINNYGTENIELRKNPLAKTELVKKPKPTLAKKISPTKSGSSSPIKGKTKLKREHSPEIVEISKKVVKKFEKPGFKPWQQDASSKKKNWLHENHSLRINPLFEKKTRESKEQIDLRTKLSSNRTETDMALKVNESREILEAAKDKLRILTPSVDATTAKEIDTALSMVLETTSKLQHQLPRSVWDRIAPPDTAQNAVQVKKEFDDDPLLKGRFVQETRAQDIVITATNEYLETEDTKPKLPFRKYHNLAPLEPDAVMPVAMKSKTDDKPESHQKSFDNRGRQQNQGNFWNKNKGFDRNRWNDAGTMRKPGPSQMRRQESPFKHRASPPRRFPSPKRPLLSPPRRPCSPPRRHFSPNRPVSPPYQARDSPVHHEYSPQRRPISPLRHMASSSDNRRQMSPPRRPFSPSNRVTSSPRRLISPRRQISPMKMYGSSTRQMSPTTWRQISPIRHRPTSPMRRQMSPERMGSPSRSRGMMPLRHQSPVKRPSPTHRMPSGRVTSPLRRQSPPPNRFADEWDIPSRGAIEQNTWQRPANERPPENVWRNERQPTTSGNWQSSYDNNDRSRKAANQQDGSWDVRDSASQRNSWATKQPLAKPNMKESWSQNSNNRWTGPSRLGNSSDNWTIRGKESRKEPWMDADKSRWEQSQSNDSWNQGDKDDWNDLPEDARDPWGDEGNLGLKERWVNFDNQANASNWSRESDKGDPWTKSKDNWQNKSQAFQSKLSNQNSCNTSMNESRWLPINDANKKLSSSSWQGSNNLATGAPWQAPNYNFQSQRPFNANPFKDRR